MVAPVSQSQDKGSVFVQSYAAPGGEDGSYLTVRAKVGSRLSIVGTIHIRSRLVVADVARYGVVPKAGYVSLLLRLLEGRC